MHIETIGMELSILYYKGFRLRIYIKWCNSVLNIFLFKQAMQTLMKCHLLRLFIWLITVCQNICLPVSRRVKVIRQGLIN